MPFSRPTAKKFQAASKASAVIPDGSQFTKLHRCATSRRGDIPAFFVGLGALASAGGSSESITIDSLSLACRFPEAGFFEPFFGD